MSSYFYFRRPRKDRGAVPFLPPGTIGAHRPADLSSLEMDLSVDEESQVRILSTFGEVWRGLLAWEELRSQRRHGHVLKKSGGSIRSVPGPPHFFLVLNRMLARSLSKELCLTRFRTVMACVFGSPHLIELLCTLRMTLPFPTSLLRPMVIFPRSLLILVIAMMMSSMMMTSVLSVFASTTMRTFRICDLVSGCQLTGVYCHRLLLCFLFLLSGRRVESLSFRREILRSERLVILSLYPLSASSCPLFVTLCV